MEPYISTFSANQMDIEHTKVVQFKLCDVHFTLVQFKNVKKADI